MDQRQCPWCRETIRADARKCRYCGSRLDARFALGDWQRQRADRKLAGVCAAVADRLDLPLPAVRAGFILLALFHGLGAVLYVALWFVTPNRPGAPTGLDRCLGAWRSLVGEDPRRESGWSDPD
ncbi:MAG: PspC domain-containing protein [Myxococcota bacterium]